MKTHEWMGVWTLGAAVFMFGCSGSSDSGLFQDAGTGSSALGNGLIGGSGGGGNGNQNQGAGKTGNTGSGSGLLGGTSSGAAPAPSSSSTSGSPTGNGCTLPSAATACESCVVGGCCAEITACRGQPECVALIQCAEGCDGDDTCVNGCVNDHQAGGSAVVALDNCQKSHCSTQCQ